ncbi:hypothetical protein SAMN06296036_1423 [Pseudobacteriovorax antillogorgiicola]|uniref:Uncharacterized protein n=1 Tax=Pseudobacteriovorax antillogorgiicola TaxID=1513793 RepID=A0A1Y6CWW9_9BACT|nr:hypothetical protein EDD56_1423 [Pseudobacteriovorax antillogorgiicola]SMF82525.1 hypothetical protein SAMN06296036_1423 [Pseudobacteriovorax antillogorgiicola]
MARIRSLETLAQWHQSEPRSGAYLWLVLLLEGNVIYSALKRTELPILGGFRRFFLLF